MFALDLFLKKFQVLANYWGILGIMYLALAGQWVFFIGDGWSLGFAKKNFSPIIRAGLRPPKLFFTHKCPKLYQKESYEDIRTWIHPHSKATFWYLIWTKNKLL